MDVREKLVELVHNARMNALWHNAQKPDEYITDMLMEDGVTVQSGIVANTIRLMRECERLKEEKESLANAVNVLEEINSDLCKQIKGVTVQEWISVKDRLPKNIGLYLVIEKHWIDGSPCRRIAKWNTVDWFTADRKSKEITPRVTHWMPLPQPPKGE
jgi:hypothetical protein